MRIPTINVAQRRSPHDIFLLADFLSQRDHQCAIFEISLADNEQSHAITVYEAKNSVLVPGNDPRAAKGASYFDSDDNMRENRDVHIKRSGVFGEYDMSKRLGSFKTKTEQDSSTKDWVLKGWISVRANPNALFL